MHTPSARRGIASCWLLLAALAAPAWAQHDSDIDMMRQQTSAPPNVMLLFDSSKSMWHVVWSQSTDPAVPAFKREDTYDANCSLPDVQRSGGKVVYDSAGSGYLSATSGDPVRFHCRKDAFTRGSPCTEWKGKVPASDCFELVVETTEWDWRRMRYVTTKTPSYAFTAPTVDASTNQTWWAVNYLHYLMVRLSTEGALPAGFRAETRVQAGKRAVAELIAKQNKPVAAGTASNCPADGSVEAYDETVRFGLARFGVSGSGPSAKGYGYVKVPIASCNKRALLTELNGLVSDTGGTPLTAALINVGRYFTGTAPLHNHLGSYGAYDRDVLGQREGMEPPPGPIPPTPIDKNLLCQSNFIVYVTDGEPSTDSGINDADYLSTFGTSEVRLDVVTGYLASKDLLPGLAGKQSIPTYTIGFSLDVPLLDAAAKAGQASYFTAQDAAQLTEKLTRSVEDILLRSATFAVGAVPGARTGAGDLYLRANFHPGPRGQLSEGHLKAYKIGPNFEILGKGDVPATKPDPSLPVNDKDPADTQLTAQLFDDSVVPLWDAQDALRDPNHPGYTAERRLLVNLAGDDRFDDDNRGLIAVLESLLGLEVLDLKLYPKSLGLPAADVATKLIGYARGEDGFDDDGDGNTAERRAVVLGEIFHSDPLVISNPSPFLVNEDGFGPAGEPSSFLAQNAQRDRVVYAGSADGFLHAFDAGQLRSGAYTPGTGREIFGYMPSTLLPSVKDFTRADRPRPLFVDGPPVATDAWVPNPRPAGLRNGYVKRASEWSSVLMVGMRNGGRGYLGLDVTAASLGGTHPSGKPYPKLLFEFTHPQLGLTWSKPVLTRVKLREPAMGDFCGTDEDAASDGDCLETWVAIFAGGYELAGDPAQAAFSDPPSQSASAGLFAVELASGALLAHQPSGQGCSIPAQPAVVDENSDGFADLVYVGDTCGNLLKWDLSSVGQRAAAEPRLVQNWPLGVLFRAPRGTGGHYRSFFQSPSVSRVGNQITVALGSGERTDLDYVTQGGDENHLYVIRDPQPTARGATGTPVFPAVPFGVSDLVRLNGLQRIPSAGARGFYLVGEPNEKFVTNPVAFGGRLFLASYTWDAAGKASCEPRGSATLLRINLANGEGDGSDPNPDYARRFKIGKGLPADPRISVGKDGKAKIIAMTSAGGGGIGAAPTLRRDVEMLYWREQR